MTVPVRYIDVAARSDMFVAATRAYGTILIIGNGPAGSGPTAPQPFTSPDGAASAYGQLGRVITGVTLDKSARTAQSATAGFTDSDVGRRATGPGVPSGTTIATVTSATEATLSAAPEDATEATLTLGRRAASELEAAIALAFRQTPPPTTVWGIQVDRTQAEDDSDGDDGDGDGDGDGDAPDPTAAWQDALTAAAGVNAQIVLFANTPLNLANSSLLGLLADHVATVSNVGGDGKERIGVAMLESGATDAGLNAGKVSDERMVLLAHRSDEDAAAALAGVIAGLEPHVSLLLKPIRLNQTTVFSDAEVDGLDAASVNWVASPVLLPGRGMYLGEGYTANPSQGNKKYVDIVRTLDDVSFRIKAALIRAIGNLRINRTGLRSVETIVASVLSPLVRRGVIESYQVVIPLLVLLEKDPAALLAEEDAEIQGAQANRLVPISVAVDYAGAIHRLHVDLTFT